MNLLTIPAAALVAILAVAGCSTGGDDSVDTGEAAPQADQEVPAEDGEGTADDGGAAAQFDVAEQRELIYSASLEAEAEDTEAVAEEVWDTAAGFDGFVTADERDGREDWSSASLTVRIPSEHFGEAMDELAALADEETGRTVDTEDVTGEAVDLESSIATRAASLERVRGLLDEAASVSEILELEAELAEREGALASLEAELASLQERIAMSTITYTVSTPARIEEPDEDTGPSTFAEGVGSGWSGLVGFLGAVSVAIGVLLPFLPLAALVLAAVFVPIWFVRRRRARPASI